MTVLLGPTPCIRCGEPVTVVRRPVMIHDSHGSNRYQEQDHAVPSTEMREVAVVVEDGTEHTCGSLWYAATDGSSVASSDTIGSGRSSARPRTAAVPCLEGLAP